MKAMKNSPTHVALIPDGNRRWARKKGLPPWVGHQAGVKTFEKILIKVKDLKIPYFTFWSGSWDNLTKRPKKEINFLFKVYTQQFERLIKDKRVHQNKINVNVIGRWQEILPLKTQKLIKKAIEITKDYTSFYLTFLLAYDGRDELISCIKNIVNLSKKNPDIKITPQLIKESLWTKKLPPVDLVIRTGCEGDPHNSAGFMMWDTAYSQLYFTETLFPAFTQKEFEKIIKDFLKRERRLGA